MNLVFLEISVAVVDAVYGFFVCMFIMRWIDCLLVRCDVSCCTSQVSIHASLLITTNGTGKGPRARLLAVPSKESTLERTSARLSRVVSHALGSLFQLAFSLHHR